MVYGKQPAYSTPEKRKDNINFFYKIRKYFTCVGLVVESLTIVSARMSGNREAHPSHQTGLPLYTPPFPDHDHGQFLSAPTRRFLDPLPPSKYHSKNFADSITFTL